MAKKAKQSKASRQLPVASGESHTEVSPLELAKLAGYTKQQVLKWCAMGMPHRSTGNGKAKRITIDRAAGLLWIKGNAVGIAGGHGGKRSGSGRRGREHAKKKPESGESKASGTRHQASVSEPSAQCPVPSASAAPRRLTPPRNLERESFGLRSQAEQHPAEAEHKPWDQLTQQEKLDRLQAKTAVEVKQFLDSQKILTEELTRKERERLLISVDEARKAWTEFLTAAARSLTHQRNALAQALISENGLPATLLDRFKLRIEKENQKVITAMRAALLDDAPAEEA